MGRKKKKCTSIYIILHFSLVYVAKKQYLCSRKSAIEYDTYTIDIRYIHVRYTSYYADNLGRTC